MIKKRNTSTVWATEHWKQITNLNGWTSKWKIDRERQRFTTLSMSSWHIDSIFRKRNKLELRISWLKRHFLLNHLMLNGSVTCVWLHTWVMWLHHPAHCSLLCKSITSLYLRELQPILYRLDGRVTKQATRGSTLDRNDVGRSCNQTPQMEIPDTSAQQKVQG